MLLTIGARETDGAVERRRLHGQLTRIYGLSKRYLDGIGRPAAGPPKPFAFCPGDCASCRYDDVCDEAVPWLTVLMRPHVAQLVDRYSERKEVAVTAPREDHSAIAIGR